MTERMGWFAGGVGRWDLPGGEKKPDAPKKDPGKGDVNERAAWTALARVLYNLDEAIVKE